MAPRRRRQLLAREAVEALLVALVVALFARTFLIQALAIQTPSMASTLLVGDHVLVNRMIYAPAGAGVAGRLVLPVRPVRRGDVVALRSPEDPRRTLVKRVVAVAGDRVAMRDKRLEVNGRPVADGGYARHGDPTVFDDPALTPELRRRDSFAPLLVPGGHVFCLGDNRDDSKDSRFFGPVPIAAVRGRVLLVYWSTDRDGGAAESAPPLGRAFERLLVGTRWQRCLRLVR